MKKILKAILNCAGACAFLCSPSLLAQKYAIVDLGEPFPSSSYALGINNRGQVVGYRLSSTGARAFLRDGANVVDLGTLGGTNEYALSLNAAGQVVGFSEWEWGARAFLNNLGVMTPLEALEGTNSYAYGINDAGHIVGYVETPAGASAFLYRDDNNIAYLNPISYAFGVNASDQVVGTATSDGARPLRAFRWENGNVVDLTGTLPKSSGWELAHARAINASGAIVGWGLRRGRERAYLFSNGRVTDLGVLSRATNSYAFGLNNSNLVVGASTLRDGTEQAFMWRSGRLFRLNDLIAKGTGWDLREARGINDAGQIVGWGTIGGKEHAFLLDPVSVLSSLGKPTPQSTTQSTKIDDLFFTAASGGSTPVTNSPLADAHVRDGSSTNINFGTNILMELMKTNSATANNRDVYFKFGIDNAPSPLGSAILRVFAKLSASGSVTTRVYSVTDTNWSEAGIKWTNKPALGAIQTNQVFTGTAGASYDIDITTYIRSEIAAGRGITSIGLHSTNNTTLLTSIHSRETNSNKPLLILNTNVFPAVSISSPANNASFPAPTNLAISATASDSDGTVTNVEFYAGSYLIGRDSTSPFSFTWTNASAGTYGLKAVAWDDLGAVTTSAVVNITITTNIVPLADAHVKSDSVTGNFGLATTLEVQTNGASGPTRDAYLKFSLSGVTNISSAKVRIFAAKSSGGGSVSGTYYSVADTNWGETSITWSNKPPLSNVLGHVSVSGTTLVWYTNDVTSFVQGENAAGRAFITLALHSQTNNSQFIKFNSRDTNASRPELVITTTNSAPVVAISGPANNTVFVAPATIPITATASDNGSVAQVEFFAGTTSLGVDTSNPYAVTWSSVAAGTYALTAKATDTFGLVSTSTVVNVTSDLAPSIGLTSPADGALFISPANIVLTATAADGDGTITQVEFFAGASSLGVDTTSPYSLTWINATNGSYGLSARATDNLGIISTSAVVNIVINARPTVSLTAPSVGENFPAYPTNITLTATASDVDGSVTNVEFFAGSTSLGNDTNAPYSLAWNSVGAGAYTLSARATDNLGVSSTSAPVSITVDVPPTVSITSPNSGTNFTTPTSIVVSATASDSDGTVSQVDFYAGSIWIGADQSSPYSVTWSNALPGVFALTAKATDNLGGSATSSAVYVTNNFSPTNLTGLRLWLDPGVGITTNGAGKISLWKDQSGNTNDAKQTSASSQPLLTTNALNGRPIVRFDGGDDYFTFQNNPFLNVTQAEVIVVLKATVDVPANSHALWNFGSNPSYYPTWLSYIQEGFGSTIFRNISDPSQPLNQYHLYSVVAAATNWAASINGMIQFDVPSNTVNFGSSPSLGYGGSSFDGDIVELLIFNRPISSDERYIVGRYLAGKYALWTAPQTPANLTATAIASNQVSLAWTGILTNIGTRHIVERKEGGGIYSTLLVVQDAMSCIDVTAVAGVQYFYRVKTANFGGESDYSNEATATPIGGQTSIPLGDLLTWLKADAGHAGGYLGTWRDQSGRGNHATQSTASDRPQAVDGGVNNLPVVRFDGVSEWLAFPDTLFAGITNAEAFVVLKAAEDMPATTHALWRMGGWGEGANYYPANNGTLRDDFGSYGGHQMGNPTQPLDQFHFYNVQAATNDWVARINGVVHYSATNNTVLFNPSFRLGWQYPAATFAGDIAEVLVFNRVLTVGERDTVGAYLNEKYDLLTLQTNPIQLTAQVLSSTQVALAWRQSGSTTSTTYIVERRLGTNGAFEGIASITGTPRLIDQQLVPNGSYTYRVRVSLTADPDAYSNQADVQTLASSVEFPLSSVGIWLRAVDLATADTTPVSTWPDYWWTTKAAIQTNVSFQPLLRTNGINGRAAVQFGSGSYLELPTVLSNNMPAEVFVVLQSATNSPAANQGLWRFTTNAPSYYPTTTGGVQDAFGSTNSRALLAPLSDLTVASIHNVAASSNLWRARLNGPIKQLFTTNTVAFNGTPLLGRSSVGASEPFAGFISELLVFNRVLSLEEQKTVRDALAQTYGITLELPHVPANLALSRTNSVDYRMTWTALVGSENGLESYFVAERRMGTNSSPTQVQMVSRTENLYFDQSALPEVDYTFQLRVVNDVGEVVSSPFTAPLADTDGDGVSDYLENQLGTNPNSSDTDGDGLPDGWELKYGLNPRSSTGRDGASGDFDSDGLTNLQEYQQGSNPADGVLGDDPLIRLRVYRPR